ncbi:Mu-like prophage major head subunit gpT family protein [Ferriphaselus sp. R-1]|uniref:Mu-like prophage major head subunit gpT family protein n=1 Tax=Ferriphaselus sp. R-1 TaxID=1485544 RepID=UPI000B1B76FD|nr:Mu-like prophage major head subunit gpT family protein [Ferriphaselus sp. R-1]
MFAKISFKTWALALLGMVALALVLTGHSAFSADSETMLMAFGGVLTQAQIQALHTTLKTRFNAGLAAAPNHWQQVARLMPSDGKSNTYAWLSQFPAFREWVGSRLHKVLAENAYSVVNRKFENTIDVQRTDIEDDNFGHYGAIAESHGQSVIDMQNDLVFQALKDGFTSLCYDGQFFFDIDHPVYPNEDGTGVAATVSNMQAGILEPWVLLCTERAARPLYLQERIKPEFDSITSTQNANVFDLDVYSFGGRWRGAAAYGFWQCAFGSKAALTDVNFQAAYTAMMKFKGDGNRKLGITPDLLIVGPDNQAAAELLLKAQQNANGASNINYNKVKLLVTPWLGA